MAPAEPPVLSIFTPMFSFLRKIFRPSLDDLREKAREFERQADSAQMAQRLDGISGLEPYIAEAEAKAAAVRAEINRREAKGER